MADEVNQVSGAGPDIRTIDFREVGATGLRRFSGFIFEEFLKELTGIKGVQIYKEMGSNDPTIRAFLYAIEHLTRRVKWRVEPASVQPIDQEAADFLETCKDDMSATWSDTIAEVMSMLQYGYSVHEIVYKRRCGNVFDPSMRSKHSDGRIGWRELPIRSQDTIYRWQFDDHGGIQGVEQLAPPHYYHVTIPVEKFLLFRTTLHKNNPEGFSALRGAYRPWYFKKHIENIEGIGIERDLAGLPVAEVPPELLSQSATPQQKLQLQYIKQLVTNIRRDEQEGIVFPLAYDLNGKEMYRLKLLSTGGQRQFDTDKIVQRYDQRIAMVVLADFLFLGHGGVGSQALVKSRTDLFSMALTSFLDIIEQIFNRYAIPRLFELNDFGVSDYPQLRHGDVLNVDLTTLGDYITKLAGAGFPLFPNADLEKHLMEVANLPLPPEPELEESLQVESTEQEQVRPKSRTIPAIPKQTPSGMDVTNDTTPVNEKPPITRATNQGGNAESNTNNLSEEETKRNLKDQKRNPLL